MIVSGEWFAGWDAAMMSVRSSLAGQQHRLEYSVDGGGWWPSMAQCVDVNALGPGDQVRVRRVVESGAWMERVAAD